MTNKQSKNRGDITSMKLRTQMWWDVTLNTHMWVQTGRGRGQKIGHNQCPETCNLILQKTVDWYLTG